MDGTHQGISAGNVRLQRPMMHHEVLSFKRLQSSALEYDSYNMPLFGRLEEVSPESTKLSQLECLPIIGNLIVCYIISQFIHSTMEFSCLSGSTKLKMYGICFVTFVLGFIPFFNVWFVYRIKPLYLCWSLFSRDVGSKGLYHGISEAGMRTEYITASNDAESDGHAYSSYVASTVTLNSPVTGKHAKTRDTYASSRYPSVRYPPPKSHAAKSDFERRGYSSFIPVPTNRNTVADSEYTRDTRTDFNSNRYTQADSEYDTRSVAGRSFESMRMSSFPEEADFLKSKYSVRQSALDNWPLK
ncbi:hypothetical protein LPJ77_002775 [Coemansia sp. RSA 2523]|nr:hypothetical protein LPJ69_003646 [Coemansia sp. RSA 1752]KAJ1807813.1 hypothetical protein LPJ77_002775 [Coemansia sp. RSA 2523]KAJ2169085.1 hypothetical protein GGH15_000812 [Coemansia sp. RSA 562]KAJ2178340.1 hypothetical protein EV181_006251 [Coemansia sp. RSA 532]KAJ2206440.1 hypothetical protein IW145_002137 [Coemansia sp. RSA 521]KAJ2526796.1 hypothetical protein IWW43_006204 [Coemansia sp. RSA 1935]KAJ2578348.1 hypothetical protein GGH19_000536 [Coemansia sp. RSA 1807]